MIYVFTGGSLNHQQIMSSFINPKRNEQKKSYLTITDQFWGAGGSSQGARRLAQRIKGIEVKLALNHWNLAIERIQEIFLTPFINAQTIFIFGPFQ